DGHRRGRAEELLLQSRDLGNGLVQTDLSVAGAHCGACMAAVESALGRLAGVETARFNLTMRRASVTWRRDGPVPPFFEPLAAAGYEASLHCGKDAGKDVEFERLLRATAVAGFAAMNIMLLSVSVWS